VLPKPGICAIDDEPEHLNAIADALNSSSLLKKATES